MSKHEDLDELAEMGDLIDREIAVLDEDDFGPGSIIFMFGPGQNERERQSHIRPVYWRDNPFNQTKAFYVVPMHQGLDLLVPGTKKRLFSNIPPGTRRVICLNGDPRRDNNCRVCERVAGIMEQLREAEAVAKDTGNQKDVTKAEKLKRFYDKAKRILWHCFVCIKHLGPAINGQVPKGKMGVGQDPAKKSKFNPTGLSRVSKDEAKLHVDPIGIGLIKDWWARKGFLATVNEKKYTFTAYQNLVGHAVDQREYLAKCPLKRGSPANIDKGYAIELTVTGKGKEQNWRVATEENAPLTKEERISLVAGYPDIVSFVSPVGFKEVLELAEWKTKNPKGSDLDYAAYRLNVLMDAQVKFLGIDKEESGAPTTVSEEEEREEALDDAEEGSEQGEGSAPAGLVGLDDIPDVNLGG